MKIWEKINEAMDGGGENNPDPDAVAINPFDFWEGANFRMKIRKQGDFPNYDSSHFDNPSALFDGDDEKLEKFYNSYSESNKLTELVAPEKFKSYEDLKTKLNRVLKLDAGTSVDASAEEYEETPYTNKHGETAPTAEKTASAPKIDEDESEDEVDSYFQGLADEGGDDKPF